MAMKVQNRAGFRVAKAGMKFVVMPGIRLRIALLPIPDRATPDPQSNQSPAIRHPPKQPKMEIRNPQFMIPDPSLNREAEIPLPNQTAGPKSGVCCGVA